MLIMFLFCLILVIYFVAFKFSSHLIMGSAALKGRWVLGTIVPRQICVLHEVSNTFSVLSHVVAQVNRHGEYKDLDSSG
mgnify:FL=1|jgi:hypothetical protein